MKTVTHLDVEAENEPYHRVIALKGRLDLLTVSKFANFMRHEIVGGARQVMIDCSALEQISSAGIGELVAAGMALEACGGSLVFASPNKAVRKVFDTVGIPRMYPVYESRDAACVDARWASEWR